MSGDLLQQVLVGGGSAAVAIAVLRVQMAYHAKELERLEKLIGACFKRIDELKDRRQQ